MRKLQLITQLNKEKNKILRKKCRPIKDLTEQRKDKIRKMFKLMYENGGMGLAAPQCGWNARVFIMNVTQNPRGELVFINPKIVEVSKNDIVEMPEGCLSFPGIVGAVDRPRKAVIEALDINGNLFTLTDAAWAARCMLHEIDHLDGILFVEKAKKLYKGEDIL